MNQKSFDKLQQLIRKEIELDVGMAGIRGGAIIPEICLFVTFRWLAGDSYLDIKEITGIRQASIYRCIWNM